MRSTWGALLSLAAITFAQGGTAGAQEVVTSPGVPSGEVVTPHNGGVIYTDIARDGRMEGPNVEMTGKLAKASKWPVTASGGVRNGSDLAALEAEGVAAAIVGKAANTDEFWESIR